MKASAQGHVEVVDTLIQAGTIVNLKKNNGQTALAIAVVNQQLKIVNKLLLVGADPTIKDEVGFTPPCMMHVHSTLDLHHVYTVESPKLDYPIMATSTMQTRPRPQIIPHSLLCIATSI